MENAAGYEVSGNIARPPDASGHGNGVAIATNDPSFKHPLPLPYSWVGNSLVSDFRSLGCLHVWRVPVWFGRTVWELWLLGEQRGNVLVEITVTFRLCRPSPI